MSESSPVFMFENEDPQVQQAYENARKTFRYFWRELTWEYRRIVPALGAACVKVPFTDPGITPEGQPEAEQMWLSDIMFDGKLIKGTLVNSPNWLTSVKEGDEVEVPISAITDWLFSINDRAYGGFTVNVMRSQMPPDERAQHDQAWGLEFGDPNDVQVVPDYGEEKIDPDADHPMSVNMAESLVEHLQSNPEFATSADENGWTTLHSLALGGSESCVEVLLKHGADPNAKTNHGMTALELANTLGWTRVANLLTAAGAQ